MSKINFNKKLFVLAPLAGYTDLPFRKVVKKFGADLTVSEMISSNALLHSSVKTFKMIEKNKIEDPFSVQISGSSVDIIKGAVHILNEKDWINGIDLNCGCPAPKVVNHGSGSTLLKNLDLLYDIISSIKKTSKKDYLSMKMRLGFDSKNHIKIAQTAEEAGVDFIAVHGRTRQEKYRGEADYDAIREVKENIDIPVLANGDIDSYEKAKYVLDYTSCDGVMIGRGSIGKPWIFYQLKEASKDIDSDIKRDIILEHYDSMIDFYGHKGLSIFRKHLHTYAKGMKEAHNFRKNVNSINCIDLMKEQIYKFFSNRF